MARPISTDASPEAVRRRKYQAARYQRDKEALRMIRVARKEALETDYMTTDRLELIDVPIKPTSIGWEHISSGRSNS